MNVVVPAARSAFLVGDINVTDGTLSCLLTGDGYTLNLTDAVLDDISGADQIAVALVGSVSVTDGEVFGEVDTWTAVPAGPDVTGLWFFMDTGSGATSQLIAWVDRWGDGRPVLIETNGGNVTIDWPTDRLFGIGTPIS